MADLTLMQRVLRIINELKVKKNGKNTFSKYDYFKLEDIMEVLNPLLLKHDVLMHYSLEQNGETDSFVGTLTLYDALDQTTKVEYRMCLDKAEVKGASGIQMSGATITYGKRQAVMNAFNISEDDDDPDNDANDRNNPKNTPKPVSKPSGNDAVTSILDTFKPFKVTQEDFERKYGKPMSELAEADFAEIRTFYSDLKKQKKTKEEIFG